MRTHDEIIKAAGVQTLCDNLGLSQHTIRSWIKRKSIPAEHWRWLISMDLATSDELIDATPARRSTERAA